MFLNIVNMFLAPMMSADRFLFALAYMFYTFAAIPYEETCLVQTFGDKYREYQKKVPALIPFLTMNFGKKMMPEKEVENKKDTPKNK